MLSSCSTACPSFCGERNPGPCWGPASWKGFFFQESYGLHWIYDAGEEFERSHSDIKAHAWGTPRAWDQSRSRFLAGNSPDAFWCIHNINFWANLQDGLVAHLYGLSEDEFRVILDDLDLPDPMHLGALNAYREAAKSAR